MNVFAGRDFPVRLVRFLQCVVKEVKVLKECLLDAPLVSFCQVKELKE
jgi:hypothetical protein